MTTPKAIRRILATVGVLLVGLALPAASWAQNMFYREVEKNGRIYVFAITKEFENFDKSGEMGKAITKVGYGPNGETMVFDSEDAINLYNFKHGKPGEIFQKPAEAPKSEHPKWKISGLMFGDFYYFADHHDSKYDNQNGFWMRRIYFTYDHDFSERFSTRFRLEANSNGLLAGGNLNVFVKDAFLRWNYKGKQQATFGISPALTFDTEEAFWGLRHVEKTPPDLYKIDSARDFGLTFNGPIGASGVGYAFQFGNDAGNGSETDKYKIVRFMGLYDGKSGLHAETNFSYGKRPAGQDRTTVKGLIGLKKQEFRVAGEYVYQRRDSGTSSPDTTAKIWSGYGVWEFAPRKADAYFRFDNVKAEAGGADIGLSGVETIDYLVLSNMSPFKTYIFGFEYFLQPSIRIGPNVEIVSYDDSAISKDVVPRLTFFWSW